MKACVVGYGAMGKIVSEMLKEELACVVAMECEYKKIEDSKTSFDVILDFSNPANLDMIYAYAKMHHKPVVFATTGYTLEEEKKIEELSQYVPVLKSANFSLGIALLNRLVKELTPLLKDSFDIEVVEAHHHHKVDAPSGTAKMLLNTICEETGYTVVSQRDGYSPRKPNEVGIHSIRGGSIVGEHEVLYCGEDEILSIKHTASSKKIFAVGAIKAAHWIIDKQNGMYSMDDVLSKEGV